MLLYALLYIVVLNIVYVFGYFLFAILLKVKEAHYFLGYNPRLFSFRIRDTQFSIGLYIPIVGLARIYTLVDGEKQRAKYPWEFVEHSIGRRLLATLGGAFALFVFGLLTQVAVIYTDTRQIITKAEVNRHGIYPSPSAQEWGLQNGDKIMAVNGKDFEEYTELIKPDVIQDPDTYYTIERNGETLDIKSKGLPENYYEDQQLFIALYVPFVIDKVQPDSPAEAAGIIPGDRITKVNGQPIVKFTEMNEAFKNDEDGIVSLESLHPGSDSTHTLRVELSSEKKIGVYPKELIQYTDKKNTLLEAIQKGTYGWIRPTIQALRGDISSRPLAGPVRINPSPTKFWILTGFYAMWYALWNLLPLPKSAFWEMIALAYERFTRKKYSYSAFIKTLNWSWVVPIGLMIWTFVNDMLKLLY